MTKIFSSWQKEVVITVHSKLDWGACEHRNFLPVNIWFFTRKKLPTMVFSVKIR